MFRISVLAAGLLLAVAVAAVNGDTSWRRSEENGHEYRIVYNSNGALISWEDANTAAQAMGSVYHLATITSEAEQEFVTSILPEIAEAFWLGGYQPPSTSEPAGGWSWVTGEEWGYTNWASGEPNNTGGEEDYLMIASESIRRGQWNDEDTSVSGGYIVELSDCNSNGVLDHLDIDGGGSSDCNTNGVPDACETLTLDDGLVAHFKFDGNGQDSSGGHDLAEYPISTELEYPTGVFDDTVVFDGTQSFDAADPIYSELPLSVSVWIKIIDPLVPQTAVYSNHSGNNHIGLSLQMFAANGRIKFSTGGGAGPSLESGDNTATMDYWHHVVVSVDALGNGDMYLDGSLVDSTTGIILNSATANFVVGSFANHTGFFGGAVDDLRIYNRSISASEIGELFSMGDCNGNGLSDSEEISTGLAVDCDSSGIPDECEQLTLDDCRVAHYTFDEDGIDIVGDNDLTEYPIGEEFDFMPGIFGNGVQFDGSQCYEAADSVYSDLPITVSLWLRVDQPFGPQIGVFSNHDGVGSGLGHKLQLFSANNRANFSTGNGSGTHLETEIQSISMDTWNHLVVSVDTAGNGTIYHDGVAVESDTGITLENTIKLFTVGAFTGRYGFLGGTVDDLRIYSRALSAAEVAEMFIPADCNSNGVIDINEIVTGAANDCNSNSIPDDCELTDNDCNENGIPDECEIDGNDCNKNNVPDDCDVMFGISSDCNGDGSPDDCITCGSDDDCYDCNDGTDDICHIEGTGNRCLHVPNCAGDILPGDTDNDGDLDLEDYAIFVLCFSGPDGEIPSSCPFISSGD